MVSIIMNCLNCERFLKEAIDSVYAQVYHDWEIIFWDNGSIDNSRNIAKSYDDRVKYFYTDVTAPLGKARNSAMKHAQGKYIAFLDCDDLYDPDKLAYQVSCMEDSGSTLSYGSFNVINEYGQEKRKNVVSHTSGFILNNLLFRYEISMLSAMVLKKYIVDNGIFFDENLRYSPDYNFFMRIAAGGKVDVIKNLLGSYRKLDTSLSNKSYDIMYDESKYTLDILALDMGLVSKYKGGFDYAYTILNHLKAIKHISNGEYRLARSSFYKLVHLKFKYRLIYYSLFTSIGRRLYIKLFFR